MPAEPDYSIEDLLRVMARLRDPQHGCPWDLAQDFDTIVPSTLEECYELATAIEQGDYEHVAEELGDVLFQVVFYARLGEERGLFDFSQVLGVLVQKLLRRHPHVFANGEIEGRVTERVSVDSVKSSWEQIKRQEREARQEGATLADIPLALPALSRAQKVQKRASNAGFDWREIDGVIEKVHEELAEFEMARTQSEQRQEDEIGDLLFTCVNLARHAGLDAEAALRRSTAKFERRFTHLEHALDEAGEGLMNVSDERKEELWQAVKKRE